MAFDVLIISGVPIQAFIVGPARGPPRRCAVSTRRSATGSQGLSRLLIDVGCFLIRCAQFHLRAYCVAAGDLTLYLYTRVLALFSSDPYSPPAPATDGAIDLAPHLTNSSLQTHRGEEGVRLLDELIGCHVISGDAGSGPRSILTLRHIENIQDQMADTLSETFKAAIQSPIHFQVTFSFAGEFFSLK